MARRDHTIIAAFSLLATAACSERESAATKAPDAAQKTAADGEAATKSPAVSAGKQAAQGQLSSSSTSRTPRRLVAMGDIHGDLDNAIADLALAGLVDAAGRWTGGETVFVQTGDIVDRGPDSKEVIAWLMALQKEAPAAGGTVIPMLGNHEVMNIQGDWRYVSPEDIAHYGTEAARRAAFAPGSPTYDWLVHNDAVVQVGDLVFAHGGISARFASEGARVLSARVRAAILGQGPLDVLGDEGPLWYRGYLLNDETLACAELGTALPALGARRMIVGHTTQKDGHIKARCNGQLLGIDTGLSDHYGGHLAALEILDGDARAIYADGPQDLPDP